MYQRRVTGFTLIELLVTIIVGSIVMAAVYGSYQLVGRSHSRLNDLGELHQSGQIVMSMIEKDIRLAGYAHPSCEAQDLYSFGSAIESPVIDIQDSGQKLVLKYDFVMRECDLAIDPIGVANVVRRTVEYFVRENDGVKTLARKLIIDNGSTVSVGEVNDLLDHLDTLRFVDERELASSEADLVNVYFSMSAGDDDDRNRPLSVGLDKYFFENVAAPVGRNRIEFLGSFWAQNRTYTGSY